MAGLAKPRFAAATIASKRSLALARVTAASFREHHPDVPFFTLLADELDGAFDPAGEPFELIPLERLALERPQRMRFQYREAELSYACTPHLIDHLLADMGFDGVLFLKQETLVLGSLAPELELLERHSVLLTPHLLAPASGDDAVEQELVVLRAGVFNGGFVGFSRCAEARAFLAWWGRWTSRECRLAVEEGLHYEQRWLDFAPSLAPRHRVLRDPGLNVGHWNLRERRVRVRDGRVTADGAPCRLFRFSGYDPRRPGIATRYKPEMTVASTGEAAQVFARYHALLMAADHFGCQRWPYAFDTFDNRPDAQEAPP